MKYLSYRGLLLVGGGVTLAVVLLAYVLNDTKQVVTEQSISLLAAEGNDLELVHDLHNVVWTQTSDIELLILFCEAQFAINSSVSGCTLNSKSSPQVTQFSNALWDMWKGNTTPAANTYKQLIAEEQWRLWGEVGRLELARYTENFSEFTSQLAHFSNGRSKDDPRYDRFLNRYRFIYAEETSDWAMLQHLLDRYSRDEIINSPKLFSPQARLFHVQGRVAELGQILDDVPEALRQTTVYLLRKADYLSLVEGPSAWSTFVGLSAKKFPSNSRLALEQAFSEILHESPDISRAGFEKVYKFAKSSSADVRLLLGIAITLATYHKPSESEAVYRLVETSAIGLRDFTKFHVLVAWNAVYRNDNSVLHNSLSHALSMAPRHQEANWLKALLAKREKDPRAGVEALNILLAIDPSNKNYQSLARHFSLFDRSNDEGQASHLQQLGSPSQILQHPASE